MDKERILSKFRELEDYLENLESIKPQEFEEYENSVRDKNACERLLQISIESIIDICNIIFSSLPLGMPSDEDDVIKKLEMKKVISPEMKKTLTEMKGMRNILVHRYGEIDNERIFEAITDKLDDFNKFKKEILKFMR